MDFATVRKKLANGSYSTLDQFEVVTYASPILVFSAETLLEVWGFLPVRVMDCVSGVNIAMK